MNLSASPIQFQFPELLLLALPLWFAFRRWGWTSGPTGWIRLGAVVAMLLVLSGPELALWGRGIDVIVVVDRSRSMPTGTDARIKELLDTILKGRKEDDRVGIVTFGQDGEVEQNLSRDAILGEYKHEIQPDGSDLNDALHSALNLVQGTRPARILVFSDGESNGGSPMSAVRRAVELGVPIDFREFERIRTGDLAVESVLLPETVVPREPFQFSVHIYADVEADGTVTVFREGKQISTLERHFAVGDNLLLFRDLLENGGLVNYEVRLAVDDDPLEENNRGAGVVTVEAGPRVLVLNADGAEDNLTRALRSGRVDLDVAKAATHPVTQDSLDGYRAVVVENVPAADFGRVKMERLAQFVEDLGGGLLLTGGERSFGNGGYFKSPLDEVLPVSMEMREEHRKTRLALAIALDRSGSMTAPVSGGKTKMDLANIGTAECIRLLSPGDSVAVIAVDSSPHVIQPMTPIDDPEGIAQRVLGIQSEGGGIFVYEALVAAGEQLIAAEQTTKHIILFSDAMDSEEPGDYKNLLAKFEKSGITTSVIGLGTNTDVDGKLLEDIAALGKGNIMFTTDAEELPRLFTEDTMSIARSSFVKKDDTNPGGIPGQLLADARLMGELTAGGFPSVDGYNLSYLKPNATLGVVSRDEYNAPWSAFWQRGLGRVAAITVEVDGEFSGKFGSWEEYGDFLITHARWLLGSGDPDDAYLTMAREGQDAVITLELDPARPGKQNVETPTLSVVLPGQERSVVMDLPFEWEGANTLKARFQLNKSGTYRPLVKLGEKSFVRGPAVTLPYSPEFLPRDSSLAETRNEIIPFDRLPGSEVLKVLAERTGGKARVNPLEVLADPPRSASTLSLIPYLLVLAIGLLILEIAGRRLSLWEKLTDAVMSPSNVPVGVPPSKPLRPLSKTRRSPAKATTAASAAVPEEAAPVATQTPPTPRPMDVFEQAKLRAKRRN